MDVAIVGGGPTGLACALALLRATKSSSSSAEKRRPPSIAVFEADDFEPKGASIIVSTPGWKALRAIDEETFKEAKADGACISSIYFEDFSGTSLLPSVLKYTMRFLIRPTLRYLLRSGIVRSNNWHAFRQSLRRGVERTRLELDTNDDNDLDVIRTNTSLVSVDPTYNNNSSVLLTFTDGSRVAASTVLACDGTFSTIRKCLEYDNNDGHPTAGRSKVLVNEQKSVWRGTAPHIETKGRNTFFVAQDEAKGSGGTAVLFPAGRTTPGSSLSIILPSTNVNGRAKGSDDARRRLKAALKALEVPIADSLMEAIDDVDVMLEHQLHVRDFDLFPNLCSGHDRIAYVGDSAHPLRPTGEGVAMALEDAWTIGNLAATAGSSSTAILSPALLRKYEELRQDRVAAVCKAVQDLANSYYDGDEASDDDDEEGGTKEPKEKKKPLQTTKKRVDQAMKDHPIYLTKL